MDRRSFENHVRGILRSKQEPVVAPHLRSRWVDIPQDFKAEDWGPRLDRFRREIIPWLAGIHPLERTRITEVGVGTGASTVALAEQGSVVSGIDVASCRVQEALRRMDRLGLQADLETRNATEVAAVMTHSDWVIFWAVLEHMTVGERVHALRSAWDALTSGGFLTVIETPNRLWPMDSHTSELPYFSWLPPELGYRYSRMSPRAGFNDLYVDEQELKDMASYLRRGHGVSFHEFDLAIGDHRSLPVRSMQLDAREASLLRRAGWAASLAGRTERTLRAYLPESPRAWFQPFLYLTLTKP